MKSLLRRIKKPTKFVVQTILLEFNLHRHVFSPPNIYLMAEHVSFRTTDSVRLKSLLATATRCSFQVARKSLASRPDVVSILRCTLEISSTSKFWIKTFEAGSLHELCMKFRTFGFMQLAVFIGKRLLHTVKSSIMRIAHPCSEFGDSLRSNVSEYYSANE